MAKRSRGVDAPVSETEAAFDAETATLERLDAVIRESEEQIGQMEAFLISPFWAIQRKAAEARRQALLNMREGLLRRLINPLDGTVEMTSQGTPEIRIPARVGEAQIGDIEGRLEENKRQTNFPQVTLGLWRSQLAELKTIRERRRV